jgi:hypothetical protein
MRASSVDSAVHLLIAAILSWRLFRVETAR